MSNKHDEKYYRLWEYMEKTASWLRGNGYPNGDLDCMLNDLLVDVEELIYETGDEDAEDLRMDQVDAQAIDDAIELFEIYRDPQFAIWDERDKKSFNLGVIALRYMKGSLYGE